MIERYVAPNKTIYDFYNKIYIKCPKCGGKATIDTKDKSKSDLFSTEIMSCSRCGYIKEGKLLLNSDRVELWLQVQCCGVTLWALNEEHLDYIEKYIGAKLRETEKDKDLGWHNQSLASRLPKWMKDSKNRNEVLKGIKRLRGMI